MAGWPRVVTLDLASAFPGSMPILGDDDYAPRFERATRPE